MSITDRPVFVSAIARPLVAATARACPPVVCAARGLVIADLDAVRPRTPTRMEFPASAMSTAPFNLDPPTRID